MTQLNDYIKQKHEKEAKRSSKEPPFYKTLIEKPYTKRLNNVDMSRELPFYDELNIVKIRKPFKRYARS